MLLSHDLASVERARGFSISRQIEIENMKNNTYIAKRVLYDHIQSVGGIANVVVDKPLIISVSQPRDR